MEWVVCICLFTFVLGGELFNTAIEIVFDLAMPKINNKAKKFKDIAAGGVLVLAIGLAIIGLIIFIIKIINLFDR